MKINATVTATSIRVHSPRTGYHAYDASLQPDGSVISRPHKISEGPVELGTFILVAPGVGEVIADYIPVE